MRIKPAGWVVILLALSGLGYWGWRTFGAQFVASFQPPPITMPDGGSVEADAGVSTDAGASVDAGVPEDAGTPETDGGVSAVETDAGPVGSATVATARSLPPLSVPAAMIAGSEGAALHLVATEQVQDAVVSVAALAAHPEAVAFGVRAVWLAGTTVNEIALLPSCDPAQLRASRLGVVGGSLAHFHLLTLLGANPPSIMQVDSEAALEAAYADGSINGGEVPISRRGAVPESCVELAKKPDALVVVHKVGRPLSMADVTAATLMKGTPPTKDEVKTFFGSDGADTFDALFQSASQKWIEAKVIPSAMKPAEAVDRRLLETMEAKPAKVESPDAGAAVPSPYGYPSWVDTH